MKKYSIACAPGISTKFWANSEITWEEFCDRLKETKRTKEAAAEFPKLPRAERDSIKDVGAFLCGWLENNRRTVESIKSRSMITLDADEAMADLTQRLKTAFLYTVCY